MHLNKMAAEKNGATNSLPRVGVDALFQLHLFAYIVTSFKDLVLRALHVAKAALLNTVNCFRFISF